MALPALKTGKAGRAIIKKPAFVEKNVSSIQTVFQLASFTDLHATATVRKHLACANILRGNGGNHPQHD